MSKCNNCKIPKLLFKKLIPEAILPAYATDGASGMDVRVISSGSIEVGAWAVLPTGLSVEIPYGHELQVRPRSGLAAKHGVTVLNSPGSIDKDFTGEVKVILINHGYVPFSFSRGDRIAQLVLSPVTRAEIGETEELSDTERGSGGFGSTGVS